MRGATSGSLILLRTRTKVERTELFIDLKKGTLPATRVKRIIVFNPVDTPFLIIQSASWQI